MSGTYFKMQKTTKKNEASGRHIGFSMKSVSFVTNLMAFSFYKYQKSYAYT